MVRVTFEKGRRQKGFKTTFGKRFKMLLQNKYLEMKANSHPLSTAYSLFQGALELSTGGGTSWTVRRFNKQPFTLTFIATIMLI